MGYRILYFYKRENTFYREKNAGRMARGGRNRHAGNVFFGEKELEGSEAEGTVKVFFCGLPEYYARAAGWGRWKGSFPIHWNFGQLLRLMQNCCEYVSADAYYLEEGFEKELAEGDPGFTPGRQRMCPELIHRFSGQFRGIDSILYLAEEFQERSGEMPLKEELLRKLHYFFYLGEKTERYTVLEENLWNEYGMPLMPVKEAGELATCRVRRLLVLDDRQEGEADWRALPSGCVYMDLWSDPGRKKQIAGNRVDIKYISEYLYLVQNLDTTGENGYNVREGNEQCQQK